jgi:hypothetical protein
MDMKTAQSYRINRKFSGVNRLGPEADHSPKIVAEVKNTWIYKFTIPYVFMAQCLIS